MERELDIACAAYKKYETVKSDASFIYSEHFIEGAQWADEHPKSPWVKCSERMPENREYCHIFVAEKTIMETAQYFEKGDIFCYVTMYNDGEYYEEFVPKANVIAWMPIPEYKEN